MKRFRLKRKPSGTKGGRSKALRVKRKPKPNSAQKVRKSKVVRTKPKPKSKNPHDRLVQLVCERIQKTPVERDGYEWAAVPQDQLAREIGVSVRTLRDMLKEEPFVTKRAQVKGVVRTLVRLGSRGQPSERDLRNELCSIWRNRRYWADHDRPSYIDKQQFGCICGLVQAWGTESPEVFAWILDHWSDFMLQIKAQEDAGNRFLEVPSIPVIRKFTDVSYEMYRNAEPKMN